MRKVLCTLLLLLFLAFGLCAMEVDSYCYDSLNMAEQMAYEAIGDCLTHMIGIWNSGSFSQATIQKAYNCFLMDHPEVYWSDGYTYVTSYVNNSVSGHHVEFDYNMEISQILEINQKLEGALIDIALTLPSLEPCFETVKAVYDWMVTNCTYDELNLDQSMYSVMISHSGVCASFSKAFQFILQCLGIPCTVVNGRIDQRYNILGSTLGHEWNLVYLDGQWYHVDVTSGLSMTSGNKEIDYTFLCATTDEIRSSHSISNIVPLPDCTSTRFNFFNYYDLMVTAYSREEVARAFSNAMAIGRRPIVRFASYRAFSAAIEDLFTNQGIFELMKALTGQDLQSLSYMVDEQTLTIRIDL